MTPCTAAFVRRRQSACPKSVRVAEANQDLSPLVEGLWFGVRSKISPTCDLTKTTTSWPVFRVRAAWPAPRSAHRWTSESAGERARIFLEHFRGNPG